MCCCCPPDEKDDEKVALADSGRFALCVCVENTSPLLLLLLLGVESTGYCGGCKLYISPLRSPLKEIDHMQRRKVYKFLPSTCCFALLDAYRSEVKGLAC